MIYILTRRICGQPDEFSLIDSANQEYKITRKVIGEHIIWRNNNEIRFLVEFVCSNSFFLQISNNIH